MKGIGFDQPLYILPFDHRGSFAVAEVARRYRGFVDVFGKGLAA